MSSSFGVLTDLFGVADTFSKPQSTESSKNGSTAQCMDSNGDIVAEKSYDSGLTYSEEVDVCKGGSATLKPIGTVVSGKVITSIDISRSNSSALKISYGGRATSLADSAFPKYTPVVDSAYLVGGKGAKAAGIVISKGKVISSSIKISSQEAKVLDSQGNLACISIFGVRQEASNELQSCDTAPAAIADTADGWIFSTSGGGPKESNTGYPTSTFNAHMGVVQDT